MILHEYKTARLGRFIFGHAAVVPAGRFIYPSTKRRSCTQHAERIQCSPRARPVPLRTIQLLD